MSKLFNPQRQDSTSSNTQNQRSNPPPSSSHPQSTPPKLDFHPQKTPSQQQQQQQQPNQQNQQQPNQQDQLQQNQQQNQPKTDTPIPSQPPNEPLAKKKSITNLSGNVKTRYAFQNVWKFWLILISSQQNSRQYQIEEIFSFTSSEYFFHYYHALPKLSELRNVNNKNISLALFRTYVVDNSVIPIKPAWEDPKNQGGGYYSFTISLNDDKKADTEKKEDEEPKAEDNKEIDDLKKPVDKIWYYMLLRIIGNSLQDEFKDKVPINGIYMKLKPNNISYDMQIWVGPHDNSIDSQFIENIINFCKEYANYDFTIQKQAKPCFISFQSKKK